MLILDTVKEDSGFCYVLACNLWTSTSRFLIAKASY